MRTPGCTLLALAGLTVTAGAGTVSAAPVSAPPPAAIEHHPDARPLRFLVSVTGASIRHLDDSYRALGDEDDQGAVSLQASYELGGAGPGPGLSLGLGLVSDEMGPPSGVQPQQAKLRALSYYALASVAFRRQRSLRPFLMVGAGVTRADFTVQRSGASTMRGRDHGAFGRASGGVRWAPRRLVYRDAHRQPLFGVHLSLETGVLLGTRLTFDIAPDTASGTGVGSDPIRVESVGAGDVMPTALFFGLGLGVTF